MGEAGRKLVARDLGTTSLDLVNQGTQNALAITQANNQTLQMRNQIDELEKNYNLALQTGKLSETQMAMMGAELISKNQQYASQLLNDLIINNSRKGIEGIQGNVDSLIGNTETGQQGYFDPTNDAILSIINEYWEK